jgi:hypothetical protein
MSHFLIKNMVRITWNNQELNSYGSSEALELLTELLSCMSFDISKNITNLVLFSCHPLCNDFFDSIQHKNRNLRQTCLAGKFINCSI